MMGTEYERDLIRRGILRWLAQTAFFVLLLAASLFLSAGRLDWEPGWTFVAVFVVGQLISALVLIPTSPELLAERSRGREGAVGWDRPLVGFVTLLGPVAIWVLSGLDARWYWTQPLPQGVTLAAIILALLGYAFLTWSMASNKFFSGVVRIQEERGHQVATGGPYRIVRHPGYLAGVLVNLLTPLILNSLWALIPAGLVAAGLVLRTALEDRTLQAELDGYRDYSARVRFRLLPGIW
jgi:protein-S-isoprenylcysteine O-methyltransferase Ste14